MPIDESAAAGTLQRGNITYLPVVPGRIEFAAKVRRYISENPPAVIAVELPGALEHLYDKALDRMPRMSVIVLPVAPTLAPPAM